MDDILDAPHITRNEKNARYAGFPSRFGAFVLDGIILGIVTWAFDLVGLAYPVAILLYIIVTIGESLYQPLFEGATGATLGKKALALVVVDKHFEKISFKQALLRNVFHVSAGLASILCAVYFYYFPSESVAQAFGNYDDATNWANVITWVYLALLFVDFLFFLNDPKHRALHDMIAGTYVIHVKSAGATSELQYLASENEHLDGSIHLDLFVSIHNQLGKGNAFEMGLPEVLRKEYQRAIEGWDAAGDAE